MGSMWLYDLSLDLINLISCDGTTRSTTTKMIFLLIDWAIINMHYIVKELGLWTRYNYKKGATPKLFYGENTDISLESEH